MALPSSHTGLHIRRAQAPDGREAADQPEIALPEDSQGCPLSQNSRKREGRGQEKAGFRLMGGGGQSQFGATVCLSCQMVTVVPPPLQAPGVTTAGLGQGQSTQGALRRRTSPELMRGKALRFS